MANSRDYSNEHGLGSHPDPDATIGGSGGIRELNESSNFCTEVSPSFRCIL